MKNKTVLDVGSGSAACAIASVMAGAVQVTANDIDPGADRSFIFTTLCACFHAIHFLIFKQLRV